MFSADTISIHNSNAEGVRMKAWDFVKWVGLNNGEFRMNINEEPW